MKQHHISVTVSRGRFANNIKIIRERVAPAKVSVVMKANAYGHGLAALAETTIDVTDLRQAPKWGDEVVLIGNQGDESVTFEEMADAFDSVHTEINLMAGSMNEITYV